MFFGKPSSPTIDMGGLYQFEKTTGVSAPQFIEHLIETGSETPDGPLSEQVAEILSLLLLHCSGGAKVSKKQVMRLFLKSPDVVAMALRGFLEDPLPTKAVGGSEGAARPELPSVIDMRSAWLARGADPDVFDQLTLWEHSRILREQEKQQRSRLADAAVAARVAQAKDDHFKRFIAEMLGAGRAKTPREFVQHLFNSTAHLPKVTQEELSMMKGRA